MAKAAIIILAGNDSHADLGRAVNALMTAREFKESGDDVRVIFDGAGTQWPGVLSDPDHKTHGLYESVRDVIAGACGFCSHAFESEEQVRQAELKLLDEYHGHPSIRTLVHEGYQVITF